MDPPYPPYQCWKTRVSVVALGSKLLLPPWNGIRKQSALFNIDLWGRGEFSIKKWNSQYILLMIVHICKKGCKINQLKCKRNAIIFGIFYCIETVYGQCRWVIICLMSHGLRLLVRWRNIFDVRWIISNWYKWCYIISISSFYTMTAVNKQVSKGKACYKKIPLDVLW